MIIYERTQEKNNKVFMVSLGYSRDQKHFPPKTERTEIERKWN